MRRFLLLLIIILIVVVGYVGIGRINTPVNQPATNEVSPQTRAELESALQSAVTQNTDAALTYLVHDIVIDRLTISQDGEWAVLWVAAYDRENDEPFGMEPGLGFARFESDEWRVILPSDPEYFAALNEVPEDLLPKGEWEAQHDAAQAVCNTSNIGPFTGYKLPWTAGKTLYLTQSIYHTLGWGNGYNDSYSMIHAFDFSTSPSALFEVRASRPGTVKYFRDSQPRDNDGYPGNYIVIEDQGTSPTSYQLYLHLDQSSIPSNIKSIGAQVQQGQLIGIADNTGFSSNHHLHFQVHTDIAWFGCSVDVRFSDVAINDGRPRRPIEAQNYPQYGSQGQLTYVSANIAPGPGADYPKASVASPLVGTTIITPTVDLSGFAFDTDNGLVSAQFAADYGDGWQPVGPVFPINPASTETQYLDTVLDMCEAGIPDGPFKIGLIAEDVSGNVTAGGNAVPVIKQAACGIEPPACLPAADEAAIYALPNYKGACSILSVGSTLKTLDAGSILVGNDVSISLYLSGSYAGRSQTFFNDDANLSDDRSPATIASAIVQLRTSPPAQPSPAWPASNEILPLETSFNLYWHDRGGSSDFQARLHKGSQVFTSSWQTSPLWNPGISTTGIYSFTVRARNAAGTSDWSAPRSFAIEQTDADPLPSALSLPLFVDFETDSTGWYGTGLWNPITDDSVAHSGISAWWYGTTSSDFSEATYDTGVPNVGSLTSPPVTIPGSDFFLRFHSRFQSEPNTPNYDRRSVLISADGGPFVEVYRLEEAVMNAWRQSPFIDLSAYAGQTIRIRFAFESFDRHFNDFDGWVIDDVRINNDAPPSCSGTTEWDNNAASANEMTYGDAITTELCPSGDVDYFRFNGNAGDRISLDVDAKVDGSQLDPYLVLYDSDGVSVLAEVDDEVYGKLQDPILGYVLPRTGTYFIKIRAYEHPSVGSNEHTYTLRLKKDADRPVINSFTTSYPLVDLDSIPTSVILQAGVTDIGSGVKSVQFLYHSSNFGSEDWVLIGEDKDGSDGWSVVWDTSVIPAGRLSVLVVQAVDAAGNTSAIGLWNLFPSEETIFFPFTIQD